MLAPSGCKTTTWITTMSRHHTHCTLHIVPHDVIITCLLWSPLGSKYSLHRVVEPTGRVGPFRTSSCMRTALHSREQSTNVAISALSNHADRCGKVSMVQRFHSGKPLMRTYNGKALRTQEPFRDRGNGYLKREFEDIPIVSKSNCRP
jgi:hypothetical protein